MHTCTALHTYVKKPAKYLVLQGLCSLLPTLSYFHAHDMPRCGAHVQEEAASLSNGINGVCMREAKQQLAL